MEFCSFACRCISVQGIHVHSCAFALHSCMKVHPRAFYVHSCRAFVCIHVHPRAFHVCIPVHSCASTCIHVHVHFMCIHAHYMCISAHPHAFTPKTLHADACISCAPARAFVCIHVHYLDILVYSCAFVCIYLHGNCVHSCASLCISSAFIAIHMTCLHMSNHVQLGRSLPRDVT